VTFEELAGIVLFFIIVGCIASIFGFRLRPPKPARTQAAPAAPSHAFRRIESGRVAQRQTNISMAIASSNLNV
jgi:hypothetical protein